MAEAYPATIAPWTAAKYLRQVCQYCGTRNAMESDNCKGCSGPLREPLRQPESVEVKPMPAATIYYVCDGWDMRACLRMNGELRSFNVDTSKFMADHNADSRARTMIREMAIAFGLPAEFFDPSKWHSEEGLGMQVWVRDADPVSDN